MAHALRLLALAAPLALAACGDGTQDGADAGPRADAGPGPDWVVDRTVPTNEDLFAVWGRSATEVYAVGWGGTILRYDGVAWRLETTTATVPLTAVHGRPLPEDPAPEDPPPRTVAVGWNGTLLERGPDGAWAPAPSTSTATDDLFGVFLGRDDGGLAVGAGGRVLGWDGTTWLDVEFSVPGDFSGLPIFPKGVLKGVWSGNGQRYYISGSGGAAYRSAGGYDRFEALDTRVSEPLRGVWGTANDNVFAVGLDGLILRFRGQWRRVTNDGADLLPSPFFFGVWGAGADDITVVGWRGTAVRFADGEWREEVTGIDTDLRSVWVDAETGTAWAVGASGRIIRRDPPPPDPMEMPQMPEASPED